MLLKQNFKNCIMLWHKTKNKIETHNMLPGTRIAFLKLQLQIAPNKLLNFQIYYFTLHY